MTPPIALTIAGSDSGGGAGIQADLKTFQAFGAFGTSAVTAITAQNTVGVTAVHPVPADVVRAQIDAVAIDLRPAALKSGMLATRGLVQTVAGAIRAHSLERYVLDPVMVASSGARLLASDAEASILTELVPLATLVTPNLDEASILVGFPVDDLESMRNAAAAIVEAGAEAALVKGGHLEGDRLIDVFFDGATWREWQRVRIPSRNTHGTGCTLSAAVAAGLAFGRTLIDATNDALDYLHRAILHARDLGSGHGPVDHTVEARRESDHSERADS
ncbi:MAG: bifunctional hydroxymethylpyrimidine kinase/phosphomethylpyrimidine kinase [Gemmatimonas sp.]|nr:bifunctional hydroxymethylpyrimidine kinase/phosphomethylpyrimidine kinase [Gemmatimonas sp.]